MSRVFFASLLTNVRPESNVGHMETATLIWTLGDRLAKARRLADISTQTMADELGVTRKTINNYESDRTPVRPATLKVWAIRCGVPYQWLAFGEMGNGPSPADPDSTEGQGVPFTRWFTAA